MSLKFTTLASGSGGNSTYVGTNYTNILVDVGISGKKVEECLKEIGLTGDKIDGIFLTHEHSDHVSGVGILSRKYNIPVYATNGTWENLPDKIGEISHQNKRYIYSDENIFVNDICVKAFDIPHDASEPVGYTVFNEKSKVAIATDIGHVTETIIENVRYCNAILLESNHDVDMLRNGSYTYSLKQRVLGKRGHLSNDMAGKLLACVMNEKLTDVFLGHLSKDNNTPDLAYQTVTNTLNQYHINIGKQLNLHMAKPYGVNKLVMV